MVYVSHFRVVLAERATGVYETRSFRRPILLVEDLFHLEMKFETYLSLSLSISSR